LTISNETRVLEEFIMAHFLHTLYQDFIKSRSGVSNLRDDNISGARVLVVEDSEEFSAFIRVQLEAAGYRVLPVVSSGEDALRSAESSRPDIVLIDVEIGGILDGIESGGRIGESLGIPFIFLSGYADEDTLNRAKTKMPSGYIVKPFNRTELKAAIEIALYKHSSESGAEQRNWSPHTDADTDHSGGISGARESEIPVQRFSHAYDVSEADMRKETSNTDSRRELNELKAEVIRLRSKNSEYREIIESLNKSLSQMHENEESVLLEEEDSTPSENERDPMIEFESE
jgi:DNA-binding response OmpR family regulator